MTMISKYIRTGFFTDFKGYDTLLISVDMFGLLEIENIFLQLSEGLNHFNFSKLKFIDNQYHIEIMAYNDTTDIGLKMIDKGKFEWRLTKRKWNKFREMTTALSSSEKIGHQYLDQETGDIDPYSLQVILSFEEYPLSFWEEHFKTNND